MSPSSPIVSKVSATMCNTIWMGNHIIIPVFKSGEKNLVSNYRPISLLCNVSKVLEKLVYDKIINFITESISLVQFGVLKGR